MDSKVGWTVTSLDVLNSIRSSTFRSIPPPSAILMNCECSSRCGLSQMWPSALRPSWLKLEVAGCRRGRSRSRSCCLRLRVQFLAGLLAARPPLSHTLSYRLRSTTSRFNLRPGPTLSQLPKANIVSPFQHKGLPPNCNDRRTKSPRSPGEFKMLLEEQRYIGEDLERLEQGVADRLGEEPNFVSCSVPAVPNTAAAKPD